MNATVVALLGAESTGKTTLAPLLAERIAADTGLTCTWVPELLRHWCERAGRVPQQHEQAAIAMATGEAIEAAARTHDVVVADTAPLMVAVYSRLVWNDDALSERAIGWHRAQVALTLVTALDLPWVADGLQREGPHVQAPVDALVRALLARGRLPWALVAGSGPRRLEAALDAVAPLLRERVRLAGGSGAGGLLTRLTARNAEPAAARWRCADCDDPACERRLRAPRGTAGY